MSLDYVSNQEIIQAARPQSAAGCVGLSYRRRGVGNHHAAQPFGLRLSGVAAAGAGRRFQSRHVDDVSWAEAAHPSDDGAHRFAANDHARRRRRGGQSGGGVRHHELRQLGDPAESGRDRRQHRPSENFSTLHSRRISIGARRSSDGSRKPATSRFVLPSTRRTTAGASGRCSTAGSRPADRRRPGAFIRRCSPGRWPEAIKKIAGMPLIIKGIATAEDAKIAVDHGVDVIYVSNHGGRQLDHGRGTIDTLPEIVEAAGGKGGHRSRRRRDARHRCRKSIGARRQSSDHRQAPRLGLGRRR